MLINGFQKLTLLDFPGRTACTVFTGGCNLRCPFCHNAVLVNDPKSQPVIPEDEVFAFLNKRRGLLDGVAVTGGEPTLQPDLPDFLKRVKDLGFAVKLDTNGAKPDVLRAVIDSGLVDYVAMDIKSSIEGYPMAVGLPDFDITPIKESVALLLEGRVEYEFRTTIVRELHSVSDIEAIGRWITGAPRFFLQLFKDNGGLLSEGMSPCTEAEMREMLSAAARFVPQTAIRGMD